MIQSSRYTAITDLNKHGTMMLQGKPPNGTIYIVECVDADVETKLERVKIGTDLDVEVKRVGRRGNAWRATAVEELNTRKQDEEYEI